MGGILPGLLMGTAMIIVAIKYGIEHTNIKRSRGGGHLGRVNNSL
ncbi:hypothetical protein CXIVA_12570 [Clostridium sp. SY8519]|nr:hypothetical protein CXIVA_12570 [Clostridium sp. SY8519]